MVRLMQRSARGGVSHWWRRRSLFVTEAETSGLSEEQVPGWKGMRASIGATASRSGSSPNASRKTSGTNAGHYWSERWAPGPKTTLETLDGLDGIGEIDANGERIGLVKMYAHLEAELSVRSESDVGAKAEKALKVMRRNHHKDISDYITRFGSALGELGDPALALVKEHMALSSTQQRHIVGRSDNLYKFEKTCECLTIQ